MRGMNRAVNKEVQIHSWLVKTKALLVMSIDKEKGYLLYKNTKFGMELPMYLFLIELRPGAQRKAPYL